MQGGQGIRDAVLTQVVASRHFPAKAVAAGSDGHFGGIVGRSLNQDGDVKIRPTQSIGNGALFAKIRQGYDDAIDAIAIAAKEVGATPRLLTRLHSAVLAFFRCKGDYI